MTTMNLLIFAVSIFTASSSFAKSAQTAKPADGVCYGDLTCQGINADRRMTFKACKQMLMTHGYDQGSWHSQRTHACTDIQLTDASSSDVVGTDRYPYNDSGQSSPPPGPAPLPIEPGRDVVITYSETIFERDRRLCARHHIHCPPPPEIVARPGILIIPAPLPGQVGLY